MTRVLLIPHPAGSISHGIPLLVLSGMLASGPLETAFLLPAQSHRRARQMGIHVLDIDHDGFRTEMRAYGAFRPDVTIDDCNPSSAYATELAGVPRITVQRTGTFPGARPGNPRHRHSLDIKLEALEDVTRFGLRQPRQLTDLFQAEVKLVPGIRSIEVLPESLASDPTYHFCGPLILQDEPPAAELEAFFNRHAARKIVYVTLGTVAQPWEELSGAMRALLAEGIAIVSTVRLRELTGSERELYLWQEFLPMHFVCANVDLMVHQCGSGTYHYQILHRLPAVTLGTGCYDREDVAYRLEQLGVATHVPGPEERGGFKQSVSSAILRALGADAETNRTVQGRLTALKSEIERTRAAFKPDAIVQQALALGRNKVRAERRGSRG